jgi:hypothetical protein
MLITVFEIVETIKGQGIGRRLRSKLEEGGDKELIIKAKSHSTCSGSRWLALLVFDCSHPT